MHKIATPGWREVHYEPISRSDYLRTTELEEREATLTDEVYVQRHWLIELRERYNIIVYELKRERKERRGGRVARESDIEDISLPNNPDVEQLQHAIARVEEKRRVLTESLNNTRRKRQSSSSSSIASSSSVVYNSDSYNSAGESSNYSNPSSESSPLTKKSSFSKSLLTKTQSKQIKSLSSAELLNCSISRDDLIYMAERTSKRTKMNDHLTISKESQLKQIENIEKSAIEISLSQGKILRTTKSMDKPPLDLMRTSYTSFYRRIN